MRRKFVFLAAAACAVLTMLVVTVPAQVSLTPKEQLGKDIFFDENLSLNYNQSCATCHGPEAGWTGPDSLINAHGTVYEGSIPGAFGDRKPPSAAYATQSPIFHLEKKGLFVGGNFWTAGRRAKPSGARRPNRQRPVPESCGAGAARCRGARRAGLRRRVRRLFREVWGVVICDPANVAMAYDNIGYSVAAYEASAEVNAFTSKFDSSKKGMAKLTKEEQAGHALFLGKAKCAKCHIANGQRPLFTDYTFDNLGLPKNPENPVYVANPGYVDIGLGDSCQPG